MQTNYFIREISLVGERRKFVFIKFVEYAYENMQIPMFKVPVPSTQNFFPNFPQDNRNSSATL